jgi:hypothetical protein
VRTGDRRLLLKHGGLGSSIVVYGRQLQGALSGWVTATENHRAIASAPFRRGAAGALVVVAGATGRVPKVLQRELRFQTFQRYCELNVALEATAEIAYRMPKLRTDPTEFAHLCLSTLEGSTGSIGDTYYANRQVDFRRLWGC